MAREKLFTAEMLNEVEVVDTTTNQEAKRAYKSFKLDSDAFEKNLPISKKDAVAYEHYKNDFIEVATEKAVHLSVDSLKKNKDTQGEIYSFKTGVTKGNETEVIIGREKSGEITTPDGSKKEYKTSTIAIKMYSGKPSSELINQHKEYLTKNLIK